MHLTKPGEGNTVIFKLYAGDLHGNPGWLGAPTVEIKIGQFDPVHIALCLVSIGG
jgi:hypothetical protein